GAAGRVSGGRRRLRQTRLRPGSTRPVDDVRGRPARQAPGGPDGLGALVIDGPLALGGARLPPSADGGRPLRRGARGRRRARRGRTSPPTRPSASSPGYPAAPPPPGSPAGPPP